ncbi:MAG: substrate-binding domain-containing protein [Clostridia bacterium]|nr:substrate-binding domain-containing protein [Clostridia bacterium]
MNLLIERTYLATEWGKDFVGSLSAAAKKNKTQLQIFQDPHEITASDSQIYVIGIDKAWLQNCERTILSNNNTPVYICSLPETDAKSSSIVYDQNDIIQSSIALIKKHSIERIALVGIGRNDKSDLAKANSFTKTCEDRDVFYFDGDVSESINRFFSSGRTYNGVICSNDIIAVYLMKRLSDKNIRVPDDIQIIGNGGLWLGQHVTCPITSFYYDNSSVARFMLRFSRIFSLLPGGSSFHIRVKAVLKERESTGHQSKTASCSINTNSYFLSDTVLPSNDPDFNALSRINNVFSSIHPDDLKIASMLIAGEKYADIAEAVMLSQDAVKYQIRKLYGSFSIHTREELTALINRYNISLG